MGKNKCFFLILGLTIALVISGCVRQGNENALPENALDYKQELNPGIDKFRGEILINAATSLREPLQKIGVLFKEVQPELTISFNFASSGALLQQIQNGAPGDIFLSAAEKQMNTAAAEGLILEESRFDWLQNKLVVAVFSQSQLGIESMEDILNAKTIAIGAPESVPAGAYAKEAIEAAGLWERISKNVVQAKDVGQIMAFVESGSAQVGFVYLSDLTGRVKVKKAFEVPDYLYTKAIYPAAIIENSNNKEAAKAFLEYLKTPEARVILEEYGFSLL